MPQLTFTGAAVTPLFSELNLSVAPGEFLAILGPNGVGKSTLLSTILGTRKLTHGTVTVAGNVGYIPQQRMFDPDLPIRAIDLVTLAAQGDKTSAYEMLAHLGGSGIAHRRVGTLSGGQQQLVRQAQALVTDPDFLLCDEPLLSLDPAAERETIARLEERRKAHGTAILFVTHNINPILHVCDRVLYITPFGHAVGPVAEVVTSETLSKLYHTDIVVAEVAGRLVIVS